MATKKRAAKKAAKTESTEVLVSLPDALPVEVARPEGLQRYIETVRTSVADFKPDLSTAGGRAEVASMAYKVRRSKTAIEALAKRLYDDLMLAPEALRAERKRLCDELDDLAESVRKPLTDWEEAQAIENQRIDDLIAELEQLAIGITEENIGQRLAALEDERDWGEREDDGEDAIERVRRKLEAEKARLEVIAQAKAEVEQANAAAHEAREQARKEAEQARQDAEKAKATMEAMRAEIEQLKSMLTPAKELMTGEGELHTLEGTGKAVVEVIDVRPKSDYRTPAENDAIASDKRKAEPWEQESEQDIQAAINQAAHDIAIEAGVAHKDAVSIVEAVRTGRISNIVWQD